MNWIAKYQEKRTWKMLLGQFAKMQQRHSQSHARQIYREAAGLRLRTSGPKAVAELKRSIVEQKVKMLDDWGNYLASPAIISQKVEIEPWDFPPPLLSYAFKYPEDYGSDEWKQAVEQVRGSHRASLYATHLLQCRLKEKKFALSAEDGKHIRKAIRGLMLAVKSHEAEAIRKEVEAAVSDNARFEAADEDLGRRSRGESPRELAGARQPATFLEAFRDRLETRNSRSQPSAATGEQLFDEPKSGAQPGSKLRYFVAQVEEIVNGETNCALRIFFLGRNRNRLLLVVSWDGRIRWEWYLNDGGARPGFAWMITMQAAPWRSHCKM
jgi:hypothetical protein